MADFAPALAFLILHEGTTYVKDPNDAGGETKFGISKRSYPHLDIEHLSAGEAAAIYKHDWWDPQPYAKLTSQLVANKVFDLAVNMGFHQAHKLLQGACCDCGHMLLCDGVFGALTLSAANAIPPQELLVALRGGAEDFYHQLAIAKPSNAKFLNGWLKRARA